MTNMNIIKGQIATHVGTLRIHANEGGFAGDSVSVGDVRIEEIIGKLFDLKRDSRGSFAGVTETKELPEVLLMIQVLDRPE
jgi:hypothetical protein